MPSQLPLCKNCHARPVYVDERKMHSYCGRTCAQMYEERMAREDMQAQGNTRIVAPYPSPRAQPSSLGLRIQPSFGNSLAQPNFPAPLAQPSFAAPLSQPNFATPLAGPTFIPPRARPDFADPRGYDGAGRAGTPNSFSSADNHRGANGVNVNSSGGSVLEEIPFSDEEFQEISVFFRSMWKHPNKPKPSTLARLYKIHSSPEHMARFQAYKTATGNARKRWHGTRRACRIGDDAESLGCCRNSQCAVCNILQHAFVMPEDRGRPVFSRFGRGIYTTATTSKAADYAMQSSSPFLSLILCEVVMGKVCPMVIDGSSMTEAPRGYDSVVGVPGLALNYDEAVVYRDDAIRPEYLVLFES